MEGGEIADVHSDPCLASLRHHALPDPGALTHTDTADHAACCQILITMFSLG